MRGHVCVCVCRELNKAYCAIIESVHPTPSGRSMAVATGNWGCGAFDMTDDSCAGGHT